MRFAVAGACLATSALAGCATAVAPDQRVVLTGEWRVAAINGHATPRTDSYRVKFENGRISGGFGCNRVDGGYQLRGDVLTAEPLAATEMACPEPGMTFEGWAFSVLQQPARLLGDAGGRFQLSNGAGTIRIERLQPPPVLAGTKWRVLSINGVPPPTGGAIRFTATSYDANFGCNDADGGYRQEGDRIEVLISRQTEKECLSIAPGGLSVTTFEEWGVRILLSRGVTISTAGPGLARLESPRGSILLQRVR